MKRFALLAFGLCPTLVFTGCAGNLSNPEDFIDKVLDTIGVCGQPMPVAGLLSSSEVEILRQWIIDLGSSGGGAPDGG